MKRLILVGMTVWFFAFAGTGRAAQDLYLGDNAIYSGDTVKIRPNVLFIIDNSAGMIQTGQTVPYHPEYTYSGTYVANTVYVRTAATGGTINYNSYISPLSSVTCAAASSNLQSTGAYYGTLKKDGTCNAAQAGNYYTGNLLNYMNQTPAAWSASTAYLLDNVIAPVNANGNTYKCTVAGTSGATEPNWSTAGNTVIDGTVTWSLIPPTGDIITMVKNTVGQVAGAVRESVNIGLMVFGNNNHGGQILAPVSGVATGDTTGAANFSAFTTALNGITLLNGNLQPVNETLWDAGLYYKGQNSSTAKISSDKAPYPSPIQYACQQSYVIVLTTGNSDSNSQTKLLISDLNNDGTAGLVDDAAIYIYNDDHSSTLPGVQAVKTDVIQLLTSTVPRLQAAAALGHGSYFNVRTANELTAALLELMSNIVTQTDTSFVAPVVPVSPENRTYSGTRVYMGFFKPITQQNWHGNLKKYGITNNILTDKNGNAATDSTGAFLSTATSFWTATADGGSVEAGGAGGALLTRIATRNIYTYLGSNASLIDASNAFTTGNAALTAAMLNVGTVADRSNAINYVYGQDAYDENGNGNTTENRSWIMGDILHSRPVVVNYASYVFSAGNESNCSVNKTMIYVGSNDGMLHAFKDCDGSEAWAFVPPDVLGHLKDMPGPAHNYYVDSTPAIYLYDANGNGTIDTGDKVVLMIGQRRGGGNDSAATTGNYYALDVSDPASPKWMWRISNATTGFSELGETWGEPKLVRMKIGTASKIVAFVGAGYDNGNEDSRYGATQTFSGTGTVTATDIGSGVVTSTGSASALNPKGRGIFAIEVATLNSGVPDFTNSGTKIWQMTNAENVAMIYSFPGEITSLDMDNDGFTDRLYAGDTGGNIWRFDVGDSNTANWTGRKIFSSNPGSDGLSDNGRKIFYKPSAVIETGYTMLFFGTGDREHPLNRGVVDRIYSIKDQGQTSAKTESDLVDVTTDLLQSATATSASISGILSSLSASTNYGWYIKLNQNPGEKVLAPPVVFNKAAYFTTYAPNVGVVSDPCNPGNLGTARIYALNYQTGEAVLNYDTSNDGTTTNARANGGSGQVLMRSDRVKTLGTGIPSGIVILITSSGEQRALIGVGGVIANETPKKGGSVVPLYWRRK
ncbi:pilus assembly protein [Geobacter pickeringii]|uniref:PilY1 beta-propeller domain-containing protein n=1 Tax=Geobacter pickeringii TaxID=345632 RepID=A0A0B5BFS3_9BACT|nr:PilC/PilY family type IV pilus protein [Geobacter pickeringii]AJE02896.1 hypothetical protein GPICK_05505 [Geobacter pickeringii]